MKSPAKAISVKVVLVNIVVEKLFLKHSKYNPVFSNRDDALNFLLTIHPTATAWNRKDGGYNVYVDKAVSYHVIPQSKKE